MAMYRCDECDMWVDDDYHPMEVDPRDLELFFEDQRVVCPECAVRIEWERLECDDE